MVGVRVGVLIGSGVLVGIFVGGVRSAPAVVDMTAGVSETVFVTVGVGVWVGVSVLVGVEVGVFEVVVRGIDVLILTVCEVGCTTSCVGWGEIVGVESTEVGDKIFCVVTTTVSGEVIVDGVVESMGVFGMVNG